MYRSIAVLCCILVVASATPSHHFKALFCGQDGKGCDVEHFPTLKQKVIENIHTEATRRMATVEGMKSTYEFFHTPEELADPRLHRIIEQDVNRHLLAEGAKLQGKAGWTPSGSNPYPYFGFMPKLVANLIPNGHSYEWNAPCFQNSSAYSTLSPYNKTLIVNLNIVNPTNLLCSDNYIMATVGSIDVKGYFVHGPQTFSIDLSKFTDDELWDVQTKGLRVFVFLDSTIQLIADVLNTVALFAAVDKPLDSTATQHNLYFLENYSRLKPAMTARNSSLFQIPPDYIQSGDFIGVIRFDGIDPMMAWAMGSSTGHTVIAMRAPNNTLYFCESTVNSSFWPTNGIQCHDYNTWIQLANAAGHNTVVVPLRPDLRKKFNADAAWKFYESVKGLDYGYRNLIYGWIDTEKDNYPCVPPDFSERCLTWDLVEPLFAFLEKVAPGASIIYHQAWNLRMGTSNQSAAALYRLAASKNMRSSQIPTIIEQDSWVYNTTRDGVPAVGPSQVCCVFVCNMWKHGGIFDDLDFNCGELTNFDDYSMNLFDSQQIGNNRPDVCKAQDPQSELCQLTGAYTLTLNQLNTRAPYAHMDETCPSLAPNYDRPSTC